MEELNHQQFGEFSSTRLTGWMTWIYITSGEHLPRPAPRSTTFWRNQSTNQPFGGKNGRMKDKKEIIIPLEHEINLVVPLQWCDLQLLAEKTMRNVGQIPILAKIHCDQITGVWLEQKMAKIQWFQCHVESLFVTWFPIFQNTDNPRSVNSCLHPH
jgi:hypothetical protein